MDTTTAITIAPWLHEESGIASDPLNLLFEVTNSADPLGSVTRDLVKAGWQLTTFGDHQYIYYADTRVQEKCQYVKNPSWLPLPVGNILYRYHLRLWYEEKLDSRVIGGVHLEIFTLPNGHVIISFDEAKREISNDFKNLCWNITHDKFPLDNDWLDSRNINMGGRIFSAIGRRNRPALARISSFLKSTRDRVLSNGYATLIKR